MFCVPGRSRCGQGRRWGRRQRRMSTSPTASLIMATTLARGSSGPSCSRLRPASRDGSPAIARS
eukprot:6415102-Alexandrium_andersonii.AAC.1